MRKKKARAASSNSTYLEEVEAQGDIHVGESKDALYNDAVEGHCARKIKLDRHAGRHHDIATGGKAAGGPAGKASVGALRACERSEESESKEDLRPHRPGGLFTAEPLGSRGLLSNWGLQAQKGKGSAGTNGVL